MYKFSVYTISKFNGKLHFEKYTFSRLCGYLGRDKGRREVSQRRKECMEGRECFGEEGREGRMGKVSQRRKECME